MRWFNGHRGHGRVDLGQGVDAACGRFYACGRERFQAGRWCGWSLWKAATSIEVSKETDHLSRSAIRSSRIPINQVHDGVVLHSTLKNPDAHFLLEDSFGAYRA